MIETQAYLNQELFYKNLIGNGKKVSNLVCLTNKCKNPIKIEEWEFDDKNYICILYHKECVAISERIIF